MDKAALNLWLGKKVNRLPVWMMRQAGRYLPEYKVTRGEAKNFLDLCLTPKLATEVMLQPLRRYDFDVAILFADILLVPYAMGQKLSFEEGEGPRLTPLRLETDLLALHPEIDRLAPVFETLDRSKNLIPPHVTLYGFAGGPWTVACYAIQGQGRSGFPEACAHAKDKTAFLDHLLSLITQTTLAYLEAQIKAGAEVLQIFESWAGLLTESDEFSRYVINPTREIVRILKEKYPQTPILGFPRGVSNSFYLRYLLETGVDGVSLDPDVELTFAQTCLQPLKPVQGNLDPVILREGGDRLDHAIDEILLQLNKTPHRHVMGLGHGILPDTPLDHVDRFMTRIRAWERTP